jgi:hypothetical protein
MKNWGEPCKTQQDSQFMDEDLNLEALEYKE